MNCPDNETLIAFAMNPLAAECDELALHVHACADCRMNLRLVNESLLAEDWCSDPGKNAAAEEKLKNHLRVLDRDVKDRHGKWLRKGEEVLFDPEDPLCFEKATPAAKSVFIANGFGFLRNLSPETAGHLKKTGSEINRFGSAIAENMKRMVGRAIPGKNLPFWVNLIPCPLCVAFSRQHEITSHVNRADLSHWMAEHGFLPPFETLSVAARKALEASQFFRVWELTWGPVCFRVFAVYAVPLGVSDLRPRRADISFYNGLKQFIHEWEATHARPANCKCYVLGASSGWDDFSTIDLPDAVEILCSPNAEDESWHLRHRDLSSYRRLFRTFVYSLYPETVEQRRARVMNVLESRVVPGSQTVEKVAKACEMPEELVEDVFDDLQIDPHGGWMNFITENGKKATRPRTDGSSSVGVFRKRRLPMVQIVGFSVLLVTTWVSIMVKQLAAEIGIGVVMAVLVVTACINGYVERKLK